MAGALKLLIERVPGKGAAQMGTVIDNANAV
jgi:hypothetical protein